MGHGELGEALEAVAEETGEKGDGDAGLAHNLRAQIFDLKSKRDRYLFESGEELVVVLVLAGDGERANAFE